MNVFIPRFSDSSVDVSYRLRLASAFLLIHATASDGAPKDVSVHVFVAQAMSQVIFTFVGTWFGLAAVVSLVVYVYDSVIVFWWPKCFESGLRRKPSARRNRPSTIISRLLLLERN